MFGLFSKSMKISSVVEELRSDIQKLRVLDLNIFMFEKEHLTEEELEEAQDCISRRNLYMQFVYQKLPLNRVPKIYSNVLFHSVFGNPDDDKAKLYRQYHSKYSQIVEKLMGYLGNDKGFLYTPVLYHDSQVNNFTDIQHFHNACCIDEVNRVFILQNLSELNTVILLLNIILDKLTTSVFIKDFNIDGNKQQVKFTRFDENTLTGRWCFEVDGIPTFWDGIEFKNSYHKKKVEERFNPVLDKVYQYFQAC